ncbi:MAG: transposase [Gemmatimonadota bacterium]
MSVEDSANTAAVCAFVEHVLVPTLRPSQIVFFDNLSAHKSARMRQHVEAAGCELRFLPRYSPDFTPIEQAWSKIERCLRNAAARTKAALEAAFAAALETLTDADARAWFAHCGYALAPE